MSLKRQMGRWASVCLVAGLGWAGCDATAVENTATPAAADREGAAGAALGDQQIMWHQGREYRFRMVVGTDGTPTPADSPDVDFLKALGKRPGLGVVYDGAYPERSWAYTNAEEKAAAVTEYRAFLKRKFAGGLDPLPAASARAESRGRLEDPEALTPPPIRADLQPPPPPPPPNACNTVITYFDQIFLGSVFNLNGCNSVAVLGNAGWNDKISSLIMAGGDPNEPGFVNLFQVQNFAGDVMTLSNSSSIQSYDLTRFCHTSFLIFCTGTWSNTVSSLSQWRW